MSAWTQFKDKNKITNNKKIEKIYKIEKMYEKLWKEYYKNIHKELKQCGSSLNDLACFYNKPDLIF